ncbi:MAG TPA: hypothetical protein VH092_20140 [Urbifossiella sp.]|jgi:hypothetical protein|nr:hypothetical protein [Urbifossiella sp.]
MRVVFRPAVWAFGLAALAAGPGCGSSTAPASNVTVQPVRGKVMVGTTPVTGGLLKLTLVTTEKTGNTGATAEIKADGSFEPRIVGDKAGLPVGKWKVVIDPVYVRDGKNGRANVPAKYTTEASDLVIDVPNGGDENVTLTLRP